MADHTFNPPWRPWFRDIRRSRWVRQRDVRESCSPVTKMAETRTTDAATSAWNHTATYKVPVAPFARGEIPPRSIPACFPWKNSNGSLLAEEFLELYWRLVSRKSILPPAHYLPRMNGETWELLTPFLENGSFQVMPQRG